MKKLLFIFLIFDLFFVGIVLKFANTGTTRQTASTASGDSELSEGQKNKWNLIETFRFEKAQGTITLESDKLQMICETSTLIELRFVAQNVAIAGVQPTISHVYSCQEIKKNQSLTKLQTTLQEFKSIQQQKVLKTELGELKGHQIYTDEDFPENWRLAEIKFSGESNFSVFENEIEKVLNLKFDFSM